MSLVFRGNFVKLYPDVGKIKSAVDRRCFTIHVNDVYKKNCSCLFSMSNDLDENMKSSSYVDSRV